MIYIITKRIFDWLLALSGICIFLPLMAIIALTVFIEDGWPIFYFKKSLGKNGKVFNEVKFRSMHTNSLEITKIGRIFRPFAMDELPQLFNIARGEMSFVGPRTYSIEHYGILGDFQRKRASLNSLGADKLSFFARLKLTPGLTGLAQIFAPKHAADEEVLRWDLEYLAKRSFSLDLWIIFISIWVTIRKKWEETTQKL